MNEHTFEFVKDYFQEVDGFRVKKMFGGQALMIYNKMVLVLMDGEETAYRGKDYGEKIWNGVLIPTSKEHHSMLMKKFPQIKPHKVLGKWLFISADHPAFEETCEALSEEIIRGNRLFGITTKESKGRG